MGQNAARILENEQPDTLLNAWLLDETTRDPTGNELRALAAALGELDVPRLVALVETAPKSRAIIAYKLWIGLHPDAPGACFVWFNLGVALQPTDPAQAATAFGNALELKQDFHTARINRGLAKEAAGDPGGAIWEWRVGTPSLDELNLLHTNLGRVLEKQGELEAAATHLRNALLLDGEQPDVAQHFLHIRQRMAVWPVVPDDIPSLPPQRLERLCGPLGTLALHDDPTVQRDVNAAWIARKVPSAPEYLAPADGYDHTRLRIGYLSTDFCSHAMSYLIAELLENHDRSRFEVSGYCASPEDGSAIRRRVLKAMDRHIPIGGLSDEDAARKIRRDEIDILVDLNGLTRGARAGVLRWKPAPVQLTYLGYIGPVALPELDGMITDRVAVPKETASAYSPPPAYVEGCFQANDSQPLDLPDVTREGEGLPEGAFVFCSLSRHYKIVPDVFAAWTKIVAACPGSVLWLAADNPSSHENLTKRWQEAGLDPARLIFAPRVEPGRYRARMALADLYLDTAPYNAGTIASDALRMGLPVLTIAGRSFVSRMAASLLTAMDVPELITTDLAGYKAKAVTLARDKSAYAKLCEKCSSERWERTLGDSAAFTRRLEDLFSSVAKVPERKNCA